MQGTPSSAPLFSRIQTQLAPYVQQAKKMLNPVLPYIKAYAGYALRWQLPISATIVLGRAIKHRYYDPKGLTEYSWTRAVSELFKGTICPLGPVLIFQQSMNKPGFGPFVQALEEAVKCTSEDAAARWLAFGKACSEASSADLIAVRQYIHSQPPSIYNKIPLECLIVLFPRNDQFTQKASLEQRVQAYDWLMASDAAIYQAGQTDTASPEQRLAAQAASDRLENLAFNCFSRKDLEPYQFGSEYLNFKLAQGIVTANINAIQNSIDLYGADLNEGNRETIAKTPFVKEQYGFESGDIEKLYKLGAYPADKKDYAGNTMAHILTTYKNRPDSYSQLFLRLLSDEQLKATNHAGDSVVRSLAANDHPAFLELSEEQIQYGEHASSKQPTLLAVAISGMKSLKERDIAVIARAIGSKSQEEEQKYCKKSLPHILDGLNRRLGVLALKERADNIFAPRTDAEMKIVAQAYQFLTERFNFTANNASLASHPFLGGDINEYQLKQCIDEGNLKDALPFAQKADKATRNKFGLPEKIKDVDQLRDIISLYNAKTSLNNAIRIGSSQPNDRGSDNIINVSIGEFILIADWDKALKEIRSLKPEQKTELSKTIRETDWKIIPVAVVLELAPREISRLARQQQLNGDQHDIIAFFSRKLESRIDENNGQLPVPEIIQIDIARQAERALKAIGVNMPQLDEVDLGEQLAAARTLLTESRSHKMMVKLAAEYPVPPDLHDFQQDPKQATDDINNNYWQHNAQVKQKFVQLFAKATEWTPELEAIANAWEERNPKFPLVNASRIAYRLDFALDDWENTIRLIKASAAIVSEVPYQHQYMKQFSSQQLRQLVELGLWSDVKCYDRKRMNILHDLAARPDWNEHCTVIVQVIHKKQGQHPDAFLISKSKRESTPLDGAAFNKTQLKLGKNAALDVMLPLMKDTLTFEEAVTIFDRVMDFTPYTFSDKLIERLNGIINAVKDWDSKQKLIQARVNVLLGAINKQVTEPYVKGSKKQAMAVTAHRAISLFRDVTGLKLPLSNVNELQKIWDIWNQPYTEVVRGGNWAQLPTVLAKLAPKERAAAIKEIVVPDSLDVMDQRTLIELLQMGVFLGNNERNAHILGLVFDLDYPDNKVIAFFAQDQFKALWTPEKIQVLAERGDLKNGLSRVVGLFKPATKQAEILDRLELTDKIGKLEPKDLELLLDHVAAKKNQEGQNLVHVLVKRKVLSHDWWQGMVNGLVENKHQELWSAKNLVEGPNADLALTPFDLMIESNQKELTTGVWYKLNEENQARVKVAMTKANLEKLESWLYND